MEYFYVYANSSIWSYSIECLSSNSKYTEENNPKSIKCLGKYDD